MIPANLRCCLGQRMVMLRTNVSICDSKFLLYALQSHSVQHEIKVNEGTGSTVSNLRIPILKSIPINTPPLPIQKRIAAVLGTLDDKIELNRRMNETLERMARALFKSWFIDFDPVIDNALRAGNPIPAEFEERAARRRALLDQNQPSPPTPLPGGEGGTGMETFPNFGKHFPDSFRDSELGPIPAEWAIKELGETCQAIFSGGTPSTKDVSFWGGEFPWLSSGETRNRFITDTEKTITTEGITNSSTRVARAGCTVIAGAGQGHTRGQTSLLTFESYINQSVVALSASQKVSSDLFLFFDLARRYDEFRQISDSHSSRGSLTTKLLAGVKCVMPPHKCVMEFEKSARPGVSQIIANLHHSRTLATLRDTLLPRLLSGELSVDEAEGKVEAES